MSSSSIQIDGTPSLPNVGYYNEEIPASTPPSTDVNNNSYPNLVSNLKNSCSITNSSQGIYNSANMTHLAGYYPPDTKSLDIPYYLGITGQLKNPSTGNLDAVVKKACETDTTPLVNQIQYLTCQLDKARNVTYKSSEFPITPGTTSNKDVFNNFPQIRSGLVLIFMLSMYFLLHGFFSSMDVGLPIFERIKENSATGMKYYIFLFTGLLIPVIILICVYTFVICNNLKDLTKYEITQIPTGVANAIPDEIKNFDILTLFLFILIIYGFVAILFTIKKSSVGAVMYTAIVGIILFIISIFIYLMYSYIPFFDTASDSNIMNQDSQPLRVFVDNQQEVSEIHTNQGEDKKLRFAFQMTFLIMFFLSVGFLLSKTKSEALRGLFASAGILILPLLWVFNVVFALQYFYIYPVVLLGIRFIRYAFMALLFIASEKNPNLRDGFSDDLAEQLDNFKNYSPSWGLIGVDELKLILNINGYENSFSKSILSTNENGGNLSANKIMSAGIFRFIAQKIGLGEANTKALAYSGIILILTIVISVIYLYAIVKI